MNIQIVLAGVGGQGILFAAKIFSELGLALGLDVLGSETHGMSQRGGSVVAHLKLGSYYSPMIKTGSADFLYAFEEREAYRNLKFLREGGACFVNLPDDNRFDAKIRGYLKEEDISFRAYDASGMAFKIGANRAANIALIGYSAGTGLLPFSYEDLKITLETVSGKSDLKNNLTAFETGFQAGK